MPRFPLRRLVDQFEAGAGGEVVEVMLVVERAGIGHPPPVLVAGLLAARDVLGADVAQRGLERVQVGVVGFLGAGRVGEVGAAFAGGDEHVGETPGLHVLSAVDRPARGALVKVDLAASHRVIAAVSQVFVEGRFLGGVGVAVLFDTAVFVLHTGRKTRPRRPADRRRDDRLRKVDASRGQAIDVRRQDRNVGVPT